MRNAWKGLVVGALTGFSAGVALDAQQRLVRSGKAAGLKMAHEMPDLVHEAGRRAAQLVPEAPARHAVDRAEEAASLAASRLRDLQQAAAERANKAAAAARH